MRYIRPEITLQEEEETVQLLIPVTQGPLKTTSNGPHSRSEQNGCIDPLISLCARGLADVTFYGDSVWSEYGCTCLQKLAFILLTAPVEELIKVTHRLVQFSFLSRITCNIKSRIQRHITRRYLPLWAYCQPPGILASITILGHY